MKRTVCARIGDPEADSKLSDMADLLARTKHWTFREHHVRGAPLKDVKRAALARFGISARHFNGVRFDLDQETEAARGTLSYRIGTLDNAIERTEERIATYGRRIEKAEAAGRGRRAKSLRFEQIGKKQRLDILRGRRSSLALRAGRGVPAICFGGRRLLRDGDIEGWRAKRAGRIYLVGAACETQGNQSVAWDGDSLRIRRPDGLGGGHIRLEGVRFRQEEAVDLRRRSLDAGTRTALTWLLFRDDAGHWHVRVTAEWPDAPVVATRENGVLGIDLNVDHLAAVLVGTDGNPLSRLSLPFPVAGTPDGVAAEMIGAACKELVSVAKSHGVAIAHESLDFGRKKAGLREYGTAHARRLSGFGYAKLFAFLASRCAREGVERLEVNPAYTSVIGRLKYKTGMAMTTHAAAALVIGRAALGHGERLVDMSGVCLVAPGRMRPRTDRRRWRGAHRLDREAPSGAARTGRSGAGIKPAGVGGHKPPAASFRTRKHVGASPAGPASSRERRYPANCVPVTRDTE